MINDEKNHEQNGNDPENNKGTERTTGTGGKETVSRSEDLTENEDLADNEMVDESLQNKLNQEDAGTGVDTEDDQRNERNK